MNESLLTNSKYGLPQAASMLAERVDHLYVFIIWLSVLLFVGVIFATLYFTFKYKSKSQDSKATAHITHNSFLEITWSVIPLAIVAVIFYWGFKDYLRLSVAPNDAYEINVSAKQWLWAFEYPQTGVKTVNDVVVPVNRNIKFVMSSEDVIHSFFAPNFRVKKDVVPNRYTTIWFQPNRVGEFQILCTQYCGDGHSKMIGSIKVVSEADFETYLKEGSGAADKDTPLPELGKKLYTSKTCNTCHTIDGSKLVGPSWKGLYGSQRKLVGGGTATADENYIRESIAQPQAKVVDGFPPVMPTFAGLLSDRDVNAIIEFIKTLK